MKKVFLIIFISLLFSNFCFSQEDDLTSKQIMSISKIMKEIKAMSEKDNKIVEFEFLIINGEYSLKNAIVHKDNTTLSNSAKDFVEKSYDGYRKDFVIFCSKRKDILICDNEEPTCLGYAAISCNILCESKCYKVFYLP